MPPSSKAAVAIRFAPLYPDIFSPHSTSCPMRSPKIIPDPFERFLSVGNSGEHWWVNRRGDLNRQLSLLTGCVGMCIIKSEAVVVSGLTEGWCKGIGSESGWRALLTYKIKLSLPAVFMLCLFDIRKGNLGGHWKCITHFIAATMGSHVVDWEHSYCRKLPLRYLENSLIRFL